MHRSLSYSPRQLVTGFWQRALMPLVFSELALAYPPQKVSDPASPVAAANGQFLMIRREPYFAVGGHSAVAGSLLEDVDLAFLFKRRHLAIRFRYAPDALSARMYRSFGAMFEGWTKNLARLFANPLATAATRALDLLLLAGLPALLWYYWGTYLRALCLCRLMVANSLGVLCKGRQVEFFLGELCARDLRIAPVLPAFGEKLVCLCRPGAGRLEGKRILNSQKMKQLVLDEHPSNGGN